MLKTSLNFLGIIIPMATLASQITILGIKVVVSYLLAGLFLILLGSMIKIKTLFVANVFLTSIVFSLFCFMEFSFAYLFKYKIGIDAIYVMLESNKHEAGEFLSFYFKPELYILVTVLIFAIIIATILSFKNFQKVEKYKMPKYVNLVVMAFCFIGLYLKGSLLPVYGAKTIFSYNEQVKQLSEISILANGHFQNVELDPVRENEVNILIISESTARSHMGLYDYYRDTNPLLTKRKNELSVFKNVSTPHTHTLEALDKVLILEDNDDIVQKYNLTMVQLFNAAGFSTHWISNQESLGVFGNSTRYISKASNHQYFTEGLMREHDEVLLQPLRDALGQEAKKKFIVVHLMATHFDYESRYPNKFDRFDSKPKTQFEHEEAYKKINTYDNAVFYNDYIVDSIISEVEKKYEYANVLYLSDHGEDVYETINEACHTESKGTKPMFDIPFFVWSSAKSKAARGPLSLNINSRYSSEDLIHTMADLAGIKFQGFDKTKSIINASFQEKERLILNNKKYEEVFSSK